MNNYFLPWEDNSRNFLVIWSLGMKSCVLACFARLIRTISSCPLGRIFIQVCSTNERDMSLNKIFGNESEKIILVFGETSRKEPETQI